MRGGPSAGTNRRTVRLRRHHRDPPRTEGRCGRGAGHAIAWAEVYAGLRPGEEPLTRAFFEARGEIVLDGQTGRRAGSYLAHYARSHGVEIADALVAAAAATSGLRLWTLNRKHYPMPDVRFYDP